MSSRSRSSPRVTLEDEARSLLRRRERPPLDRLVALIHEVNPTGRDLTPPEVHARYALKSSLQSLLVRHFHADLGVDPDPTAEGFALLRHALLDLDACHARVASLDEDARTLVEGLLAERSVPSRDASRAVKRATAAPSAATSAEPNGDTPSSLVSLGREALDAYDYDLARSLFDRALSRGGGLPETALALLDLLVDALASDAEALALVPRFGPAAMRSSEVLARLAIAAARTGDEERCVRWVRESPSPRCADALAVIVRSALGRGNLEDASRWLDALRERSPSHSEIASLDAGMRHARSVASEPEERAASEALARGHIDVAERIAREALSRSPDSESARRTLRQVAELRREREVDALRTTAREALERANTDALERCIGSLLELGIEDPALVDRLRELRAIGRAREENAHFAEAIRQYTAGDLRALLLRWHALSAPLRRRVREATGDVVFDWMDRCETPRGTDTRSAVDAVSSLRSVARSLPALAPREVLTALVPHEAVLRLVPLARTLAAEARASLRDTARSEAATRLHEARCSLDAGDLSAARAGLRGIDRESLDPILSPELRALTEGLDLLERVDALEREVDALRSGGDIVRSAARIDRRLELEPLRDRDRWVTLRDALRAEVREAWAVTVLEGSEGPVETGDLSMYLSEEEEPQVLLGADGSDAAFVVANGRWVFVRLLSVHDGSVLRSIALRTPEAIEMPEVIRDEARLELVGQRGRAVVLDLERGDVHDWIDLASIVGPGRILEGMLLFDRARIAWVGSSSHGQEGKDRIEVIDVATRTTLREFPGYLERHLLGHADARGFVSTRSDEVRFVTELGVGVVSQRPLKTEHIVHSVTTHPAGSTLAVFSAAPFDDAAIPVLTLYGHDGRATQAVPFPACHPESVGLVASDCSHTAFCIDATGRETFERRIHWVSARGGSLEVEREVVYEGGSWILTDPQRRHLVWAVSTPEGIALHPLPESLEGPTPPTGHRWDTLESTRSMWRCEPEYPQHGSLRTPRQELVRAVGDDVSALARELRSEVAHDPHALLELASELLAALHWEESEETLRFGFTHHPTYGAFADHQAKGLIREARWREAAELLEGLSARFELPGHLLHLLGTSLLWCDRHGDARSVLLRARAVAGDRCELDDALELAGSPTSEGSGETSPLAGLLGWYRAADEALARGEAGRALTLLSRPGVLGSEEVQGLARLAVAHLATAVTSARERFQKALALSQFVAAQRKTPKLRIELPIVERWSGERLDALAGEVERWLDEVFAARREDPTPADPSPRVGMQEGHTR